jgi:hypothetical protein
MNKSSKNREPKYTSNRKDQANDQSEISPEELTEKNPF